MSLFGLMGTVALVVLGLDVVRRMSGSGLILLAGLMLLFLGERVLGFGDWRWPVTGLGALVVFASVGLRGFAMSRSVDVQRKQAHTQALVWSVLVLLGLALYGLTSETAMASLGFDEDAGLRWKGTIGALWPIAVLVGLGPVLILDSLIARHPVRLPAVGVRHAVHSGLIGSLAIALVFPVNYLGSVNNQEWDMAYFRTTRPSESTVSLVRTLTEPVEVKLFFPAGNDVRREVEAYFTDLLAQVENAKLTVDVVDQAMEPKLAEELKVRDNGVVVFVKGEDSEKLKLNTDIDKSKRDLKQLDSKVQKHLMKLSRGQRVVYMLAGHGEASSRDKDDPLRKLSAFKSQVLEAQNYKVKTFGVTEGSAVAVPDDAAAVIIAAPEKPMLPEEEQALLDYAKSGGRLLVFLDVGGDPLSGLLGGLGVKAGTDPLVNAQKYVRSRGGKIDRLNMATNKYGSHESVRTLSRNSSQLPMVLPTVVSVTKSENTENKVTTLVRSFPNTWADKDGDLEAGADEEKQVFEVAVAVSNKGAGDQEMRAVVIGDVSVVSDPVIAAFKGNGWFAMDTTRWLVGDDDISGGAPSSEEDVKIQHSREEDQMWFWTTIAGMPLVVLILGTLFATMRLRRRAS
jgi:hypothetical protein